MLVRGPRTILTRLASRQGCIPRPCGTTACNSRESPVYSLLPGESRITRPLTASRQATRFRRCSRCRCQSGWLPATTVMTITMMMMSLLRRRRREVHSSVSENTSSHGPATGGGGCSAAEGRRRGAGPCIWDAAAAPTATRPAAGAGASPAAACDCPGWSAHQMTILMEARNPLSCRQRVTSVVPATATYVAQNGHPKTSCKGHCKLAFEIQGLFEIRAVKATTAAYAA